MVQRIVFLYKIRLGHPEFVSGSHLYAIQDYQEKGFVTQNIMCGAALVEYNICDGVTT